MSRNFTFSEFIINEDRAYMGHRIGDILTFAHSLQDDIESLSARQVMRMSDEVVNQIRKILHRQWEPHQQKHLRELQAVAVMMKNAIEGKKEKGSTFDLRETIKMAIQKLEDISSKLGTPVNKAQAPPEDVGQDLAPDDFQLTGDGPQDVPDGDGEPQDQVGNTPDTQGGMDTGGEEQMPQPHQGN